MDLGHWQWKGPTFDPEDHFGFIYLITNNSSNRKYIGKKQFTTVRRYTPANKKRARITRKDTNWKTYTGSNEVLNEDIELYGKHCYSFEMLSVWNYKSSLWYAEIKEIVDRDAMARPEEYYNGTLPAMKFRPKADEGLYNVYS